MTFHVDSEVGPLRKVMLHRPDLELQRLTPANCADLLFDDVLWVKRARQEHNTFADVLRDRGVEVLYLSSLLGETMAVDTARKWLLERTVTDSTVGPLLAPYVRDHLESLAAPDLAWALIGGVIAADMPAGARGLAHAMLSKNDFVLAPLPNHLFTRDTSCWIYGGVSLNPMAKPARRRETANVEAIYRFHPRFVADDFELWYGGVDDDWGRATVEGGDVLVIGEGAVLIGMGERTTPFAVERLAQRLFARNGGREVLAVELPRARSFMHLDTVMTMVDRDAIVIYPGVVEGARTWSLTPGDAPDELVVAGRPQVFDAMTSALGLDELRVFTTGGDEMEADREQWDDGNNVLAVEPGVVVAYDRNVDTNTKLRRAGIEVITIEGFELSRGTGRRALHELPARARRGVGLTMLIVAALGGNALLRRGEPLEAETAQRNAKIAAEALAVIAREHRLVVTHGNGPQIGLLALQSEAYTDVRSYPLDVLGAESEGMIGYLLEQELGNALPGRRVASLLTQTVVDPHDPAFGHPTKPIGPVYGSDAAHALAAQRGWAIAPDGDGWRRVVASPAPRSIVELSTIELLLEHDVLVVCTGGGGIPVVVDGHGARHGVEAVIDKDLATALLAEQLGADLLVLLTDVATVELDWGTPSARALRETTVRELHGLRFASGSMGPKIAAATAFVANTGLPAAIGALGDAAAVVHGTAGTRITP